MTYAAGFAYRVFEIDLPVVIVAGTSYLTLGGFLLTHRCFPSNVGTNAGAQFHSECPRSRLRNLSLRRAACRAFSPLCGPSQPLVHQHLGREIHKQQRTYMLFPFATAFGTEGACLQQRELFPDDTVCSWPRIYADTSFISNAGLRNLSL